MNWSPAFAWIALTLIAICVGIVILAVSIGLGVMMWGAIISIITLEGVWN